MLRLLLLLLVVANLSFYAWTQGVLDGVIGLRSQGDREPDRINRQVHPEALRVLAPAASAAAAAPLPDTTACLEAGPYTPAQAGPAEGVLQTVLPAGSWVNVKNEVPAVWIVYMGKYPNREALQKKLDELKRLRVASEEVRGPADLEGGLSLGRFDTRAAAESALGELTQKGVRTARVATLAPATVNHTLRVERADATLQSRLVGLRSEALLGKPFVACAARP